MRDSARHQLPQVELAGWSMPVDFLMRAGKLRKVNLLQGLLESKAELRWQCWCHTGRLAGW